MQLPPVGTEVVIEIHLFSRDVLCSSTEGILPHYNTA